MLWFAQWLFSSIFFFPSTKSWSRNIDQKPLHIRLLSFPRQAGCLKLQCGLVCARDGYWREVVICLHSANSSKDSQHVIGPNELRYSLIRELLDGALVCRRGNQLSDNFHTCKYFWSDLSFVFLYWSFLPSFLNIYFTQNVLIQNSLEKLHWKSLSIIVIINISTDTRGC